MLAKHLGLSDPPLDSLELLDRIVIDEHWSKPEYQTTRELAEAWLPSFLDYLRKDLSELNRLGRHSHFAFNSSSEDKLQGAAFIEPSDSEQLKAEKNRRQRYDTYVAAIRKLTNRQLELACTGLLELIGITDPKVTKFSADRGIDFFGKLELHSMIFPGQEVSGWHRQMSAWLIGQAKHYVDGTVGTAALRELVGSVRMVRSIFADRRAYPALQIRTCDSVFHLLVTTGRLSAEVWREVDRHGVIGIDGEMFASFLASRGVGVEQGDFVTASFEQWLSSFENHPVIDDDGDPDE